MREAAQGGGEMAPPELVRTFYETVVSPVSYTHLTLPTICSV